MSNAKIDVQGPTVGGLVGRNLPVVLLFAAGYFGGFSVLWGPVEAWKIVIAGVLVACLLVALDLGARRRRKLATGNRAAHAEAQWPWWRRGAAIVGGSLLGGIGVYQSLGIEVDVGHLYPLISGLCLIVSLAFGISLVLVALPRERWRRKPASHARAATKGARGSTMKVSAPRGEGHSGVWGGFGSKPGRKTWRPGS